MKTQNILVALGLCLILSCNVIVQAKPTFRAKVSKHSQDETKEKETKKVEELGQAAYQSVAGIYDEHKMTAFKEAAEEYVKPQVEGELEKIAEDSPNAEFYDVEIKLNTFIAEPQSSLSSETSTLDSDTITSTISSTLTTSLSTFPTTVMAEEIESSSDSSDSELQDAIVGTFSDMESSKKIKFVAEEIFSSTFSHLTKSKKAEFLSEEPQSLARGQGSDSEVDEFVEEATFIGRHCKSDKSKDKSECKHHN